MRRAGQSESYAAHQSYPSHASRPRAAKQRHKRQTNERKNDNGKTQGNTRTGVETQQLGERTHRRGARRTRQRLLDLRFGRRPDRRLTAARAADAARYRLHGCAHLPRLDNQAFQPALPRLDHWLRTKQLQGWRTEEASLAASAALTAWALEKEKRPADEPPRRNVGLRQVRQVAKPSPTRPARPMRPSHAR